MTSIVPRPPIPRAARARLAMCAALSLTLVACGGDDDDDGDPEPDAAMPSSAYLVVSRVVNPDGRSVYLSVLPDLAPTTIDLADAHEVSGLSRAFVFDGAVFAMDGETGEIARYDVSPQRELVEADRLSMRNLGITGFSSAFAFISPTRAYYIDTRTLQVVVWNPQEMVIDNTFSIADLAREGMNIAVHAPQVGGNRVISAIGWSNLQQAAFRPSVGLLVLDAQADELIAIVEDDRCAIGGGGFFDAKGDFYVIGDTANGVFEAFQPTTAPDACLLRLPVGESDFDSNFVERMADLAENPYFSGLDGTSDRHLLTRGFDPSVDLSTVTNPSDYLSLKAWLWRLIELDSRTPTEVALPTHVLSFGPFSVDGAFYLPQFDEENQRTVLYRLDGDQPVESVASTGEIQNIDKIR